MTDSSGRSPPDGGFAARLQALRRSFAPTLRTQLQDLVTRMRDAPLAAEALNEVGAVAHRIHGTAGSYGFAAASAAAGAVESLAIAAGQAKASPEKSAWDAAISALESAIAGLEPGAL